MFFLSSSLRKLWHINVVSGVKYFSYDEVQLMFAVDTVTLRNFTLAL